MKTLLVIGFNLAVCLLGLEAFSAFLLRQMTGAWTTPSGYVATLQQRDTGSNASEATAGDGGSEAGRSADDGAERPIEGELEAKTTTTRWMIQPYFGFARNPDIRVTHFKGKRIRDSINPHGLYGPDPLALTDEEHFVVALTGGSVALELFLFSREPLIAELEKLPAARGRKVEIVCLALGGMKQPQQVLQLNYFLALGARFDLVVNVDGFNEVALPLAENLPRGVNPFYPRNWVAYSAMAVDLETAATYGRLAERNAELEEATDRFFASALRRRTWSGSALYAAKRRQLEEKNLADEMRLRELMSESDLAPQQRGPRFPHGNRKRALPLLVSMWSNSSEQMAAVAESRDIPYFHFLQPNQYVRGSKPLSAWELEYAYNEQADYARNAIPGYPLLIAAGQELAANGVAYHDLTAIYAGISESIYKDTCCHVNEEGGRILARAIGDAIRSVSETHTPKRARLEGF